VKICAELLGEKWTPAFPVSNKPQSKRFTVTFVWQGQPSQSTVKRSPRRIFNALRTCLCRGRRIFEETVRILRVAIVFGETDPPQKKPAAGISRGGLGLT
jgi:hypothetical protein